MIEKFLIFYTLTFATICDASGVLLCEFHATSPATCSGSLNNYWSDYSITSICSGGGSMVTEFEIWGGCSSVAGSGNWYTGTTIHEYPGMPLATSLSGPSCYCRIKSINGSNVPPSNRWVFWGTFDSAPQCADSCSVHCAANARTTSSFRSVLFQALGA